MKMDGPPTIDVWRAFWCVGRGIGVGSFDFSANQTYTMDVFSQCSRKASRLSPARGTDQDGGAS